MSKTTPPLRCRVLGENEGSWIDGWLIGIASEDFAVVAYSRALPIKLVPIGKIIVTDKILVDSE